MDKIDKLRTKLSIMNTLDVELKGMFDSLAEQYTDEQMENVYINILDVIEDGLLDVANDLSKEKCDDKDAIGFQQKAKDIETANKYHKIAKVNIDGEVKHVKLTDVELVDYEDGIDKIEWGEQSDKFIITRWN